MMFDKGIVVIAITKRGVETALNIKKSLAEQQLLSNVFAPEKYGKPGVIPLDKKLDEFVKTNYNKVDAIVAVMATGIIIRIVAPFLQNKLFDPAVVAVDASGRFAISLLSGHLGGANELTKRIAEGIGATPVVTTATDVLGKQSVDELARVLHLKIVNPESLVAVNSAIVNDDKVVLIPILDSELPIASVLGFDIRQANTIKEAMEITNRYDAGVIVTKSPFLRKKAKKPVTFLKPFIVAVGIGARKEVAETAIVNAVKAALDKVFLPLERVNRLATVSIKRDSVSMINAAEKLGLNLEFIDLNALGEFRHVELSPDSEIVKRNIGIGGVCERAALIAAGEKPRLILKKTVLNGVTVAIAEGE
jgi:cobalt-precorrin 5A hydrolase